MKIVVENECRIEKVEEKFLGIIPAAISSYLKVLPRSVLVDIRLLGSVPRGDARVGHSDIDFVALCTRRLDAKEINGILDQASILSSQFAQVRKVDLEFEDLASIASVRNFIFMTDSVSVFGKSLFSVERLEVDAIEIAKETTPDLANLISRYRWGVESARSDEEKIQYSRWIGKDILKSMRRKLIVEKAIYSKSPSMIHDQLREHYPKYTSVFDDLLSLYIDPIADSTKMVSVLDDVEAMRSDFR